MHPPDECLVFTLYQLLGENDSLAANVYKLVLNFYLSAGAGSVQRVY